MELKLSQQLVGMCHGPLLQVLLEISKDYDSLERIRCIGYFEGNCPRA